MHQFIVGLILCVALNTAQSGCGVQFVTPKGIDLGVERMEEYLPLLKGKKVCVVANHTSMFDGIHLVDTLLKASIEIISVFAPEHGFRGDVAHGMEVQGGKDPATGLKVHSLYGKNKKPSSESLKGVEVILFDIQDVGVRFYTYISTMHYVLEAAAENNIPVIILDRPNPLGGCVDGPVLDTKYQSFVGMHPIPIIHGLTVGELATMIKGEGWINAASQLDLTVIPCEGWKHGDEYKLPIPPSPNLKSMQSVYLYPSLCLFEGTNVSLGRGTDHPFEWIGFPGNPESEIFFTPEDRPGVAENPPHEGVKCGGIDLTHYEFNKVSKCDFNLQWLLQMYKLYPNKQAFFSSPDFFDKLAGSNTLRKQISSSLSEDEIRKSWAKELDHYKVLRKKYLLYEE